jgi:hypothetical protein
MHLAISKFKLDFYFYMYQTCSYIVGAQQFNLKIRHMKLELKVQASIMFFIVDIAIIPVTILVSLCEMMRNIGICIASILHGVQSFLFGNIGVM